MITKRDCPVCGEHNGGVLYQVKLKMPKDIHLPEAYDIVSCDNCGACYADTTASENDYNDYYTNHNIYGGWTCNSSSIHDYEVICRILDNEVTKDALIADIGCGNGGLLKYLQKEGYAKLLGIDPSESAIVGLRIDAIDGVIGSIYGKPEDLKEKADVIIFTMVLEHLLEPRKALEVIRDYYLKINGMIIVTWPYFEDMITDNSPIINNFNHEHINYFSIDSVDRLFGKYGFMRKAHHISYGQPNDKCIVLENIAVYQSGKKIMQQTQEIVDKKTKESILEYTRRVENKEKEIISQIAKLAESQETIAIWGTGSYFMHMMAVSELENCDIRFIIDNNKQKQGKIEYGYSVVGAEMVKNFDGTIIITSMLYGEAIERQIREMGNMKCNIVRLGG